MLVKIPAKPTVENMLPSGVGPEGESNFYKYTITTIAQQAPGKGLKIRT